MVWYGVVPDWHLVLTVPTLIVTAMLALGVSLWLGPINVRFRDVKHTLPFLIQIWMYASPIVYASSIVPASVRWLYALNPMVGLIERSGSPSSAGRRPTPSRSRSRSRQRSSCSSAD